MARTSSSEPTKAQRVAKAVADAVGAGKAVQLETVDFNDPNRPKTCLEVDFPILPVNQVAAIEGNAGKPIYQMSKWWARRRSSVFRSLLLSASMKAPEDTSQAAKAVWDVYYANHQKKRSFANLKVADIFMGGGTTVVEGNRLGMQMFGNDLNPVAWFVVKTELADVKKAEVEALLADIEAEVKPQVMPFYACNGPHGERGAWTRLSDGKVMGDDFDPLALKPEERKAFKYEGPEIIYVFWSKHGPCQVTGCGHRTPVMSSPVLAVKELSIKAWPHKCPKCKTSFDIEESEARMAPDVTLVVADGETPFAPLNAKTGAVICPSCGEKELVNVGRQKGKKKKVALSLLVHPQWLQGEKSKDKKGQPLGGSVTDDADTSARWYEARAKTLRLLEVRGKLPDEVTCPDTGVTFSTSTATIPTRSNYACGACGTVQDVLTTVKASGKSGPVAPYAIQAYSPKRDREGVAYGGRYFLPADDPRATIAAQREWEARKDTDLAAYWPRSELPYGFMTHLLNGGIPNHGFTHWWTMFNPRQLLVNALLLKAINEVGGAKHRWEAREYVLAAFQQYLRNQNMFCFWDIGYDKLVPHMSNNNYHPKSNTVENCVFPRLGRGNWETCSSSLLETLEWSASPWELVSNERLASEVPAISEDLSGKSEKAMPGDGLLPGTQLSCGSATELPLANGSFDLVITDPPFGGLLHYSELADFFYVWLRLVLKGRYPDQFTGEYTPKTLEAVSNRARHPEDADAYYQRLLTASWKEAHRILKPGGTLAFTFHHSEDAPWVSVLESLFDAGFYLEATYPIRSDETKGDGEFGSRKIEYDIVHVCRKRTEEPTAVSWAKMRRQVLQDVRALKHMLEHHQKAGLPEADLQVIRRGKALEYFSRHYGKVFVDEGSPMRVIDALVGINQEPPKDAVSPEVEAFKAWGRTHHKTAEERADRLHERAAKAKAEAQGRMAAFDRIANNIPVGQPILLGHHSEKRHRRDIERMRTNLQKGFEASDKAKSLEGRAQAVEENRAISSDDPDALPKLRERLAEAQANADAIAAGIRALKRLPKEKWRDPEATKGIPASVRSFADVMGFAPTATNARADVRRLAKRIEELEQRQAAPTRTAQHGDVTVREEGNRTQLVFPGKPSEEVRKELKAAGFRWAPSEGVWQRHRSSGAWYQAEQIAKRLAR